ncbi:MAG: PocR ligand-binding domain-containing protein [Anaerolineae bacterium]|nr:PocR ligand-binding domain-containing protein [Anaerolineae bacterium]
MVETDSLLTTKQLQSLLQVDRITIYRMLNDGRLQGFKVGGQWRFSRQVIERWLLAQRGDLGVPEAPCVDDEAPPSPGALPITCVRAIQGIFAEALQVGTVTTAADGPPLTPVAHSCAFCDLILATEAGRERCAASWRRAIAGCGDTPALSACHTGLNILTVPVRVAGQLVGAVHAGQFLSAPPGGEAWPGRIAALSAATGVDENKLQGTLARVPILDEGRQGQIAGLLARVAATLSEIGEERLNLLGRLQRIAEISNV